MTPEERSILERTLKLAQENNEMLRSLRRSNRLSIIWKVFYWAVIVGLSFGAYYFIEPYLNTLTGLYGQIQTNMDSVQEASNSLRDLLK